MHTVTLPCESTLMAREKYIQLRTESTQKLCLEGLKIKEERKSEGSERLPLSGFLRMKRKGSLTAGCTVGQDVLTPQNINSASKGFFSTQRVYSRRGRL